MPRAGWCRDCGEWVWLDPEGACPAGHDADCVSHEYDAEPTPGDSSVPMPLQDEDTTADGAGETPVGVGSIPPAMRRFNWGAFMIPAVWAVVYGVWPVLLAWVGVTLLPLALSIVVGMAFPGTEVTSIPASWLLAVLLVSEAGSSFVRLWSGVRANELYWARESARLSANPDAIPKVSAEKFLGRQTLWAMWGGLALLAGLALSAPSAYQLWKPYGLEWAAIAEPFVFVVAQVFLAIWLSRQMRQQNPPSVAKDSGPAEDITERRW